MEKPVRLDKFLADAGAGTRSEVKKYIQKGQVQVNGKTAKKPELKGKCILLVDDIYTTGATVDACSRTLIENGAGDVFVLTLASGGNRKPNIE